MRGFVAPTDHDWYRFLRAWPHLEEVNFWRPGGSGFSALKPGEPFFFKLKAPHDAIGGFGQFARFAQLLLWMASGVFGEGNGGAGLEELRVRIPGCPVRRGRHQSGSPDRLHLDRFPTFFSPDDWVPVPPDWKRNIVRGRGYDLSSSPGHGPRQSR